MSATDWAAVATGVISVVAGGAAAIKWLVKHYLWELKPNHGTSLSDRVKRIEDQIDKIYDILMGGAR